MPNQHPDSRLSPQLVAKLEQHLTDDPDFSREEVEAIRSVLRVWRGLAALGWMGKLGLGLAAAITTVAAAVVVIKDWLSK